MSEISTLLSPRIVDRTVVRSPGGNGVVGPDDKVQDGEQKLRMYHLTFSIMPSITM